MKKIYGVGTGPGDKEHLTLKAVNVIKEASVIFAPNNRGKNMAIDTASDFIKDKKVVLIDFPMGKVTVEDYKNAARIIETEIPEGESGAFLTIGDPMVYSTFIYIIDQLEAAYKNVEIELVPGVPSFIAAASQARQPITVKDDSFLLCDDFENMNLENIQSLAILKTSKRKEEILDKLEAENFRYSYVKRATLENQEILEERGSILADKDYISLILARKK